MASTVELIKERLSVADVIGSYIKLEKSGANLKARCPFHNEKTPSFMVSPSRGGYYCFGCGEKGDMFTFVQKFEGVDFMGALKILAERAGVEIVHEKTESKDERNRLFSILEDAASFYETNLTKQKAALNYLKDRGLTERTIKEFRLGYAPNEWRETLEHLRKKKWSDKDIELAGFIKKDQEGKAKDYYDRFRGRIMFPLSDPSGRVIAFSGRIFEKPQKEGAEPAKYINSPETPIFSKSKVLYGYDKAKEGIRKWGFTILVEGQMDMVMSQQSGFRNTVALSGTALTEEHVALLTRLSNNLVLALDADEAGLKASGRSAELALSRGMDIKVARLEGGKDPADLVAHNVEDWKKAVRESRSIIEFYIDILSSTITDRAKLHRAVSTQIVPYIAAMKNPTDRDNAIRNVAFRVQEKESTLTEEVQLYARKKKDAVSAEALAPEGDGPLTRPERIINQLIGLYITETNAGKHLLDEGGLKKKMTELLGKSAFEKTLERATLSPDLLFEGEVLYENITTLDEEIEHLLLHLKYHILKKSFEELMYELREREAKGESKRVEELLRQCQELSRELSQIDILLKK